MTLGLSPDDAADRFVPHRERLRRVAYDMTGSIADAEDCVQECFVRWERVDRRDIDNDEAYLVRIVTRLAIDSLRRRAARRETYVGPWLPEPRLEPIEQRDQSGGDPADAAALADSLSFAFLVLLERLSAAERAAFLLHDVFGVPFDEVASALERDIRACRQLASRARRKLRSDTAASPEPSANPRSGAALDGLLDALISGDVARCLAHLSPGIVLTSDGGPLRRAARRQVVGPDRVLRLVANLFARDSHLVTEIRPVLVNGAAGLYVGHANGPLVFTCDVDANNLITHVWIQMNPDKVVAPAQ